MSETMYDCYASQFTCLNGILSNRQDLFHRFAEYYVQLDPDRIYLIGSGSSYNACCVSTFFIENVTGKEVTVLAPTEKRQIRGQKPLVVAVSQSGRSTNTIDLVKKMKNDGIPVVSLTDPVDTPVGRIADLSVLLDAKDERVGAKTRGYTATIFTLQLMFLEAMHLQEILSDVDYEKYIRDFKELFDKKEEYLETCQSFFNAHAMTLKSATCYIFSGKGTDAMTAKESALKVLETLCYPAISYEYEELLHGPLCSANGSMALFLYLSHDDDQVRMQRTMDIIGKVTPNCYLVSDDPSITGINVLNLPSCANTWLTPFTYILFSQLISALLPPEMGRSKHPGVSSIFEDMGTKVPRPTV